MTAGDGADGPAEQTTEPPAAPLAEADTGGGFVLHLPSFDGPLDLLLQLIEHQELDITELSVLAVTEQYLAHLRSGERISLSALAEFVAMGARLLLLKSRSLLPREDAAEETADEDGDAADLVAALQEYRRYRHAADHLRGLEDDHRTGYRREATPPEAQLPSGLEQVTLDSLVSIFREVLERLPQQQEPAAVEREPVRLVDRIQSLVGELERGGRVSFRRLVEHAQSRLEVIVDFLAVLELIKLGFLDAQQADAFGEIELVRIEGASAPSEVEPLQEADDG